MMASRMIACCSLVVALASTQQLIAADVPAWGSPAPALEVAKFIKGEPVKKFEPGKVYVVEFWATWCGPCKAMMPHLSELQQKYKKDVTVISVSVWEEVPTEAEEYVATDGDRMQYRVAMDLVPEGADAEGGRMSVNWLNAYGQEGIPVCFIVNQKGQIAWVGHPGKLDQPLAAVVSGKWDIQLMAAQEKRRGEITERISNMSDNPDEKEIVTLVKFLTENFSADAGLEPEFAVTKLGLMLMVPKYQKSTLAYGKTLVDTVLKGNRSSLAEVAELLLSSEKVDEPTATLAVAAAQQADKLASGKDGEIASTLAEALFQAKNAAAAITTMERAIELAKTTRGFDPDALQDMKGRLKDYRAESAEKPKASPR